MKPTSLFVLAILNGLVFSAFARDQSGELFQAIRTGDHAALKTCLANGASVTDRDAAGNTPLIAAAFYADLPVLETLISAGADVNAANDAGATALIRAATDTDKARFLIANKADVKMRSKLGNDALILAARRHGNAGTVKLLLDGGADVNAQNTFGATPLMAAVAAEDEDSAQLLLDAGADVNAKPNSDVDGFILGGGRTPLMWAAFLGNERLVNLLLERGAQVNEFSLIGGALTQAAWANQTGIARTLLDHGANVDQRDLVANFTPLHWAASSEYGDATLASLLLEHGADANAEGGQHVDNFLGVAQTPLLLAQKRGETRIVEILRKAGASTVTSTRKRAAKPRRLARDAVDVADVAPVLDAVNAALPPIEKTATESPKIFLRHASRQDCVSCHQQQIPRLAINTARAKNVNIDTVSAQSISESIGRMYDHGDAYGFETTFYPEPAIEFGYSLWGMAMEGKPASAITDSLVHHLATVQHPDGHWNWNLPRPPIESSALAATALALQALQHYAIPTRQREFAHRVERARAWLEKAIPETTEERAYKLLGLGWAGSSTQLRNQSARELIGQQRADGGWGQLPKLPSDAFATGQALYALMTAGDVSAKADAIQNGLRFLLRTQLQDGTWHVQSRTFPFQPPMESAFPHGADSWISTAATSWAVMAIATALDPAHIPATPGLAPVAVTVAPSSEAPLILPPVDFVSEVKPLLERSCVGCHSGEKPKGNYEMTSRAGLLKGGNRGEPAVVAGQSTTSPLIRVVTDQIEDLEMPPLEKRSKYPSITSEEAERIRGWIDQGAAWPGGTTLSVLTK